MNTLVLNTATQIERKITIPMILEAYGLQIFGVILLAMTILLINIIRNVRIKNEIRNQYERYQMLSKISNEYLYEYHVKTKHIELSKSSIELFGDNQDLSELKYAVNAAALCPAVDVVNCPYIDGIGVHM